MNKSDFKKKFAEIAMEGLRGFVQTTLGRADHLPDGSIKIEKKTVQQWQKMIKATHYKLEPNQKIWANAVADRIIHVMSTWKKKVTKKPQDPRIPMLKTKFEEYCKNIRGFKPILKHAADTKLLKERLADYDEDKILDCFDWFLSSKDCEDLTPGISTCLSANIFNKFLSKR